MFLIASLSAVAVIFIFYFIAKDAIPFFQLEGFKEFFTSTSWYPSAEASEFGAFPIFMGTAIVTMGAIAFSVPLGLSAAVCLSEVFPFSVRQLVKPVIEVLSAIPSVAYGFFALVIFAPLLQDKGGYLLSCGLWVIGVPVSLIIVIILGDVGLSVLPFKSSKPFRWGVTGLLFLVLIYLINKGSNALLLLEISSGTNALNVSIILGIMALPTIVSVAEDALQAVGRDLREGSYALGATRAETVIKVVMPSAVSGLLTAVILGVMRAVGETMVVWMASGNAAIVPTPFYNLLEPVRTLTATIAGDMGEADHVTGSSRYHVLFAMAMSLLLFSFMMNMVTEMVVKRYNKLTGKR